MREAPGEDLALIADLLIGQPQVGH
jgi:hypothetical protein